MFQNLLNLIEIHLDFKCFVKNWFSDPSKPCQAKLDLNKKCFSWISKPHQAHLDFKYFVEKMISRYFQISLNIIIQKGIAAFESLI